MLLLYRLIYPEFKVSKSLLVQDIKAPLCCFENHAFVIICSAPEGIYIMDLYYRITTDVIHSKYQISLNNEP